MRATKVIQIVNCHAEGEVGDVIVGGVLPPPGNTVWAQSRFIAQDDALRRLVLQEPRGGVFRHVNLLVPPKNPAAIAAFIIMEPADVPPMSGSNAICVATVLLDTGLVPMVEPETRMVLEAPGGLIAVTARCRDGKAERIEIHNHPSFADKLGVPLAVEGLGTLTVDTAYGGDSFVIVDPQALGLAIRPEAAKDLCDAGLRIIRAANAELGFRHPENRDWNHISFCLFATPVVDEGGAKTTDHAVVIRPGKIDRSPTGTGCSARMAVLRARGALAVGEPYVARSIIGSRFECRVVEDTAIAGRPAIVPAVAGRAWISGTSQLMVDPTDPWPTGYRLSDTWPVWSDE